MLFILRKYFLQRDELHGNNFFRYQPVCQLVRVMSRQYCLTQRSGPRWLFDRGSTQHQATIPPLTPGNWMILSVTGSLSLWVYPLLCSRSILCNIQPLTIYGPSESGSAPVITARGPPSAGNGRNWCWRNFHDGLRKRPPSDEHHWCYGRSH